MEELAPRPLPLGAWLDIVAREYLDRFVPEGGGGLKIVLAEDAGIAETIAGLEALARERELHVVRIDAGATRGCTCRRICSSPWPARCPGPGWRRSSWSGCSPPTPTPGRSPASA